MENLCFFRLHITWTNTTSTLTFPVIRQWSFTFWYFTYYGTLSTFCFDLMGSVLAFNKISLFNRPTYFWVLKTSSTPLIMFSYVSVEKQSHSFYEGFNTFEKFFFTKWSKKISVSQSETIVKPPLTAFCSKMFFQNRYSC